MSNRRPVKPRQLVFRGTHPVAGVVFDEAVWGPHLARRLTLRRWHPGARLFRIRGAWVVIDRATQRGALHRDEPGAPLLSAGSRLLAAPLAEDELAPLAASSGDVVLVQGGVAVAERPEPADPSDWLHLDGWSLLHVESLGAPPKAPELLLPEVELDARGKLLRDIGASPEVDAARGEMIEALRAARAGRRGGDVGAGALRGRAGLLDRLRGLAIGEGPAGTSAPSAERNTLGRWWEQVTGGPRAALFRAFASSIGRRQADYLRRMVDMFERGDLDEALRHAIGLGGDGDGATRPSLGRPTPRSSIDLSVATPSGRSSSLFGAPDLFVFLRQTYRDAFERLKLAGRIREAAFVLVDLLGEIEEAVALLEQAGEVQLAAELAEARGLAPGLVVRQWFIAGDVERAVTVARRTGAFHDALLRLGTEHPDRALQLRLLWADSLADAGAFVEAADVLEPTGEHERLRLTFLEAARCAGGRQQARALPQLLKLQPERAEELYDDVERLLEPLAAHAGSRAELLRSLLQAERVRTTIAVARPLVRALLKDRSAGIGRVTSAELARLSRVAAGTGLDVDFPAAKRREADTAPVFVIETARRGAAEPLDTAPLPSGHTLVALGEAGCLLVDHRGEVRHHFDAPTEQLVALREGHAALACVRRGPIVSVRKLDLVRRKVSSWIDVAVTGFARWSDGVMWFVHRGPELLGLDLHQPRPKTLWRVTTDEPIAAVEVGTSGIALGTVTGGLWMFRSPGPVLRGRTIWENPVAPLTIALDAELPGRRASLLQTQAAPGVPVELAMLVEQSGQRDSRPRSAAEPVGLVWRAGTLVEAWRRPDGVDVVLVDPATDGVRGRLQLEGASGVVLGGLHEALSISDDLGRVVVVDVPSCSLIVDFDVPWL